MSYPLVSVIIPTYNYAHYISQAIESVINQTYPIDWVEIIVIDDGSTDNTGEIVQGYAEKGFPVKYFFQENKGKACATYNAIIKSSGKYIFNLDADDYFYPSKIEATVKIFELHEDIVHVASPARTVTVDTESGEVEPIPEEISEKPIDGNLLSLYFFKNHILFGGGSTYAARASALKQIKIPVSVDMYIDEFLLLAIFPLGKSYFIKEPLSVWRSHDLNYSGKTLTSADEAKKGQRLLGSSAGVLSYLKNNNFDKQIINIYRLHHLTRKIAFKEKQGTKRFSDVVNYAVEVFFRIRPGWKIIKNYYVINRLIPTVILKTIKSKVKARESF